MANVKYPKNSNKIDIIDFIEDHNLSFNLGTAIRYICESNDKDPDKKYKFLLKAVYHIDREINKISTNGGE